MSDDPNLPLPPIRHGSIRFALSTADGRRSSIWKVIASRSDESIQVETSDRYYFKLSCHFGSGVRFHGIKGEHRDAVVDFAPRRAFDRLPLVKTPTGWHHVVDVVLREQDALPHPEPRDDPAAPKGWGRKKERYVAGLSPSRRTDHCLRVSVWLFEQAPAMPLPGLVGWVLVSDQLGAAVMWQEEPSSNYYDRLLPDTGEYDHHFDVEVKRENRRRGGGKFDLHFGRYRDGQSMGFVERAGVIRPQR